MGEVCRTYSTIIQQASVIICINVVSMLASHCLKAYLQDVAVNDKFAAISEDLCPSTFHSSGICQHDSSSPLQCWMVSRLLYLQVLG